MTGFGRRARELALQALYFWEVGKADPEAAVTAVLEEHAPEADDDLAHQVATLVTGTVTDLSEIDALLGRHSEHWRVERLAVVDRLILRLASWELLHVPETPPAVVINEALELARRFSADDAVKFVNGVLDAIRKGLAVPGLGR